MRRLKADMTKSTCVRRLWCRDIKQADWPVVWLDYLCESAAAQHLLGCTGSPEAPVPTGSCTWSSRHEMLAAQVRPLGCHRCWSWWETGQTGKAQIGRGNRRRVRADRIWKLVWFHMFYVRSQNQLNVLFHYLIGKKSKKKNQFPVMFILNLKPLPPRCEC